MSSFLKQIMNYWYTKEEPVHIFDKDIIYKQNPLYNMFLLEKLNKKVKT